MHVLVGGQALVDPTPTAVAAALRERKRVTTSAPTPRELLAAYRAAAIAGAQSVVSMHVSAELSGAHAAALVAARQSPVPVTVVDSRTVSMALGLAVRAACEAAGEGRSADDVAAAGRATAQRASLLFSVEDLDALRKGGRIGPIAAWLGNALMIKPVLGVADGRVVAVDKQRTSAKVQARLALLGAQRAALAGTGPWVVVAHLDAPDAAARLVRRLEDLGVRGVQLREVDPVVAAHAGPGALAVVVAPRLVWPVTAAP